MRLFLQAKTLTFRAQIYIYIQMYIYIYKAQNMRIYALQSAYNRPICALYVYRELYSVQILDFSAVVSLQSPYNSPICAIYAYIKILYSVQILDFSLQSPQSAYSLPIVCLQSPYNPPICPICIQGEYSVQFLNKSPVGGTVCAFKILTM